MPPLLNPARERATDAPVSDSAEGDGGHARARKWPVSEYGRKRRRLPLWQVPRMLCPRGARAMSVHRHLPSMPSLYFILNVFCCADLGVARSGGSARPSNFSRPGGGVDSQGQGYEHAFPKFAGAWISARAVSAAP